MRKATMVDEQAHGRKPVPEDNPEDRLVRCARCGAEEMPSAGPTCGWCWRFSDEELRRLLAEAAFEGVEAYYEERAEGG